MKRDPESTLMSVSPLFLMGYDRNRYRRHQRAITSNSSINIELFKVVLPQIPAFADEQLKHAASEIFKSMRYGLVIHRDNDR